MTMKQEQFSDDITDKRLRVLRLLQSKPDDVLTRDWYAQISRDENVSVPTLYRWFKDAQRGKVTSDRAPMPVALKVESGPIRVEITSRSISPPAVEYGLSLLINNSRMDVK